MTSRKSYLRAEKIPEGVGCFTAEDLAEIKRCIPGRFDEPRLIEILNLCASTYCRALAVDPTTNPKLALKIRHMKDIAEAADRLLTLLADVPALEFFAPTIEDKLGLGSNFFADTETHIAAAGFEKELDGFRDTLGFLIDHTKGMREVLDEKSPSSSLSTKEAVVYGLMFYWSKLHGDIPKSGAGPISKFVFAAANPILRIGGQSIASVSSVRHMIASLQKRMPIAKM